MTTLAVLVTELKLLRKGRGLYVTRIGDRVGAALRDVCQVSDEDGPAVIRRKVAATLQSLANELPMDIRLAVLAAFAIVPDARLPLYRDRVTWTAQRLNRDPRTARRRIDDGIVRLAELASLLPAGGAPEQPMSRAFAPDWRTARILTTVTYDRDCPEVFEQRRIVACRDRVTEVDPALTVHSAQGPVDVAVFFGGTLHEGAVEPGSSVSFALTLPRSVDRGESHDYTLSYRLPGGEAARPHFVCVPRRPCDAFDLRLRFDRSRMPQRIRPVANGFPPDLELPDQGGRALTPNVAGELHLVFRDLMPGLAYGVRWD